MSQYDVSFESEADLSMASDTSYSAYEEELIADNRARLTPAQHVESKLFSLLKSTPHFVSHSQTAISRR